MKRTSAVLILVFLLGLAIGSLARERPSAQIKNAESGEDHKEFTETPPKSYQAGTLVFNVPASMKLDFWSTALLTPNSGVDFWMREYPFEKVESGEREFLVAHEKFLKARKALARTRKKGDVIFREEDLSDRFNQPAKFFAEDLHYNRFQIVPGQLIQDLHLFLKLPEGYLHFSLRTRATGHNEYLPPAEDERLFHSKQFDLLKSAYDSLLAASKIPNQSQADPYKTEEAFSGTYHAFLQAVKDFLPHYQWTGTGKPGSEDGFRTRYGLISKTPDKHQLDFRLSFEHQDGIGNLSITSAYERSVPTSIAKMVRDAVLAASQPEFYSAKPQLFLKPVQVVGRPGYELETRETFAGAQSGDEIEVTEFVKTWFQLRPQMTLDYQEPQLCLQISYAGRNSTSADRRAEDERNIEALKNIWQTVIDQSHEAE